MLLGEIIAWFFWLLFYIIGDRLEKLGESLELFSLEAEVLAWVDGLTFAGRFLSLYIPTVLPLSVCTTADELLVPAEEPPTWFSILKKSSVVIFCLTCSYYCYWVVFLFSWVVLPKSVRFYVGRFANGVRRMLLKVDERVWSKQGLPASVRHLVA